MNSSSAGASLPTATSTSAGKSLLSRLKSPFSTKVRNWTDFSIQLDDPHRQYAPGDVVTGSVIIKVVKPVRITHIVVALHGFVQVFKNPNSPGDGYRAHNSAVATGKGPKKGGYFGNGFASLFEDEAVLCGEGRLAEGAYHFGFELEFPDKGLPSSIDFERGTISYMLTATMTRPITISPVVTCDKKIFLMECIDIAALYSPKPRLISLDPISRRPKGRANAKKKTAATGAATESLKSTFQDAPESSRMSRILELGSQAEAAETPRSPSPSDISFDSQPSSLATAGRDARSESAKSSDSGTMMSRASFKKKSITATIELQKAGYLRGDTVPLKIFISHNKPVRNTHGIIVTLFRQARVDMHPDLPLATNGKGDKIKADDYYPKSKTGLGGLSLSSAGSSHLFRKDLAQSFAPLLVDPRTLTAEIKASVRVPDEAFPTITSVPGAMISFRYYIEVVIDVQGKLAGIDRYFPNSGMVSVPSTYGNTPAMGRAENACGGMLAVFGTNFVDTGEIRREKSVVACLFEIVVGTMDSDRRKGKSRAAEEHQQSDFYPQDNVAEIDLRRDGDHEYQQASGGDPYLDYGDASTYNIEQHDHYYNQYPYDQYYPEEPDAPHPPAFPIPNLDDEANLPEKERLRRAEARLLPSQPPASIAAESSGAVVEHAPTAPILPDQEIPYALQTPSHPTAASPLAPTSLPFHPTTNAPAYTSASTSPHSRPTDDKQELHRRRLESERSTPSNFPADASAPPADAFDPSPSAPPVEAFDESADALATFADAFAPSAPAPEELERAEAVVRTGGDGIREGDGDGGGPLPRYER